MSEVHITKYGDLFQLWSFSRNCSNSSNSKPNIELSDFVCCVLENNNMFMYSSYSGKLLWKSCGVMMAWGKDIDDDEIICKMFKKCHPIVALGKGRVLLELLNMNHSIDNQIRRLKSSEFFVAYEVGMLNPNPVDYFQILTDSERWLLKDLNIVRNIQPKKLNSRVKISEIYKKIYQDVKKESDVNKTKMNIILEGFIEEKEKKDRTTDFIENILRIYKNKNNNNQKERDSNLTKFFNQIFEIHKKKKGFPFLCENQSDNESSNLFIYKNRASGLKIVDKNDNSYEKYVKLSLDCVAYDFIHKSLPIIFNISPTCVVDRYVNEDHELNSSDFGNNDDDNNNNNDDEYESRYTEILCYSVDQYNNLLLNYSSPMDLQLKNRKIDPKLDNERYYQERNKILLVDHYCDREKEKYLGMMDFNRHVVRIPISFDFHNNNSNDDNDNNNNDQENILSSTEYRISSFIHVIANYELTGFSESSRNWHFFNVLNPFMFSSNESHESTLISHVWGNKKDKHHEIKDKFWRSLINNFHKPSQNATTKGKYSFCQILTNNEYIPRKQSSCDGGLCESLTSLPRITYVEMAHCSNGSGHLFSSLLSDIRYNSDCEDNNQYNSTISSLLKQSALLSTTFKASKSFYLDVKIMLLRYFLHNNEEWKILSLFEKIGIISKLVAQYWIQFNDIFMYDTTSNFHYALTLDKLFLEFPVNRYTYSHQIDSSLNYDYLRVEVTLNDNHSPEFDYCHTEHDQLKRGEILFTSDDTNNYSFCFNFIETKKPQASHLTNQGDCCKISWAVCFIETLKCILSYNEKEFTRDHLLVSNEESIFKCKTERCKLCESRCSIINIKTLSDIVDTTKQLFLEKIGRFFQNKRENLDSDSTILMDMVFKNSNETHPLIFFDVVRRLMLQNGFNSNCCYWPNVPRYLIEFMTRDYVIHKNINHDRMLMCIHTRAHLAYKDVKLKDGKKILCEIMEPSNYLIYMIKMHYFEKGISIYPYLFGIYELYNTNSFEKNNENHFVKVRSISYFEEKILAFSQCCVTFDY